MSTTAPSVPPLSKLLSRHEVAERTLAFHFEKPTGWTFKGGQAIDITLLAPPETDAEGNTRTFSIASGPHETTLMVATRMRDTAFKRVLKTMPLGTAVKIEGPSGNLILHNDAFLEELQALEKKNPNYKLIASMTEMEKSQRPWHGETGLINTNMLAKYLKDTVSAIYYIAGPPEMVKGLHRVVNETGVDDDDVRTEDFAGY